MITRHIIVSGKVQGVFYRATAKEMAEELGVLGWVRNTNKGQVEMYVQGDHQDMDNFVEWCRTGPRGAEVTGVKSIELDIETEFQKFEIKR